MGKIEEKFVGKLLPSLNSEERETLSWCAMLKITTSDLQKVKETTGEQEFDKLSAEVLQEVETCLKKLGLSKAL